MIAVITGDIVHSRKLSQQQLSQLLRALNNEIEQFNKRVQLKAEFYRGDSFQIALAEPSSAARLALLLITRLKSLKGRATLSLAVAEGNYQSGLQGEAFELSGLGLDRSSRGEFTFHSSNRALQNTFDLATQFLSYVLLGHTSKQAEVLRLFIDLGFPDHQVIAEKLGTTRQNVSAHLSRAGAHLVENYIELFEKQLRTSV